MPTSKKTADNVDPTPEDSQPVQEQSAPVAETPGGKTVEQLVDEVLGGRYGDHDTARKRLTEEGHDTTAVISAVNSRIAGGAPHSYKPTAVGLVKQVQDGEWGGSRGLAQRLAGAGFSSTAVNEVLSHLDKE